MDKTWKITPEIFKHESSQASKIELKERIKEKESKDQPWGVYDAELRNLESTFIRVLIKKGDVAVYFQELLEQKFHGRLGDLRGVELGGPGSRLFFELNEGGKRKIFSKSVGITLNDLRTPGIKSIDNRQGHKIIEGDIFAPDRDPKSAYQKVSKWLGAEKADFMVERMLLGLERYNTLKFEFFFVNLKRWYKLLGKGGIFLAELPVPQEDADAALFQRTVEEWVKYLKEKHAHEIKAESEFWKIRELNTHMGALYLEKIEDTPLPRQRNTAVYGQGISESKKTLYKALPEI